MEVCWGGELDVESGCRHEADGVKDGEPNCMTRKGWGRVGSFVVPTTDRERIDKDE
jgi:hypothetical protein